MASILKSPQLALTIAAGGTIANFIYTYKTNKALEEKIIELEKRLSQYANELDSFRVLDKSVKDLRKTLQSDLQDEVKKNKRWKEQFGASMDSLINTTEMIMNKLDPNGDVSVPTMTQNSSSRGKSQRRRDYESESDEDSRSDDSDSQSDDDSDEENALRRSLGGLGGRAKQTESKSNRKRRNRR